MTHKMFLLASLALLSISAHAQKEKKISLVEALKTAVERNLVIELQRINLETENINLDLTRAIYEPTVTSTTDHRTFDREATNTNEGVSGASINVTTNNFNSTFAKQEDFGFNWSLGFNNNLRDSNEAFSLGETYSNSFSVGFEQQLLRGFSLDREVPRNQEFIARGNLEISKHDMAVQVANVLQETENAYWDLVYAIEQLKVRKNSLKLGKQLYEQNKVKVDVGTLARIELVNDEATIATREREVITAENSVFAAEDILKKQMNLPPEEWGSNIIPTDPLKIEELTIKLDEDYSMALENRPELLKNRVQTENSLLDLRVKKNDLKPELKLSGSYFVNGASVPVGLTDEFGRNLRDENGNLIVLEPSKYSDAFHKTSGFDFPGWNVALNLTWAPFNKQAKLNLAKAEVQIRQQELITEQTKVNIMEEVRIASRELDSNLKAIAANEKALKYRQENLRAEVQKFQNGLSTNYRVSEVQQELADQESQLIQSKIDYMKSVVKYYKALGVLNKKRHISF